MIYLFYPYVKKMNRKNASETNGVKNWPGVLNLIIQGFC